MRILHVVNTIYQGGIRTLLLDMVKYQLNQGNEVAILCLIDNDKYFTTSKEFAETGVKIIRGASKDSYSPRSILNIKKHLGNYDVVHVHQFPNQLYAKVANNLIPCSKRPVLVTTEHNTYNNRRKYPVLKYLDRWFYKGYDGIICISDSTEENLKTWLKSKSLNKKIKTITNGIPLDRFANAENKLAQILGERYREDHKYLVMVARMEYPKDPHTLLNVLPLVAKNIDIIYVGDGNYCDDIREASKKMGVENRVHIMGNRSDVPEILKGSDIGVLSTKWDGFGLVAAEYMAAGLPVLITNVDGLRDVVNDKDATFPYQDSKTLATKITKLLTDEEYRKEKVSHSLNRARHFSVDQMNEKYLQLYNELLKDKQSSQ